MDATAEAKGRRKMRLHEDLSFGVEISANTIKYLLAEEGVKMRDAGLYVLLIELEVEL